MILYQNPGIQANDNIVTEMRENIVYPLTWLCGNASILQR